MTPEQKRRKLKLLQMQAAAGKSSDPKGRGIGATIYDNVIGDPNDGVNSYGEQMGTFLRRAIDTGTMGVVGDEANAKALSALPGRDYEGELNRLRSDEANMSPASRTSADITGVITGALTPLGVVGTLGRGAGLATRVGASAATGAGMGATYGFMEGEGLGDRKKGALTGGLIGGTVGALAPAVGAGVQKVVDGRVANKAIKEAARGAPSSDDLLTQGNAAYKAVDDAGVQITPKAFDRTRADILEALRAKTGFDELPGPGSLTPNSARVMQIMDKSSEKMAGDPTAALPFRSIDKMRRQAGAAAGNITNKTDQKSGMTIIEGLDDFVRKMSPDDVVAGDLEALNTAIPKARDIWGRMSRSQLIDDAMSQEGNYLSGGSSAIRNQFAKILRDKKLSRGFSDAEKLAMGRVVRGSLPEQIMNLMGGGLGQLAQIGAGFGAGGIPGAALGAGAAALSRKASEAITRKNAEIARALVANGTLKNLPVASDSTRKTVEALMRRGAATAQ